MPQQLAVEQLTKTFQDPAAKGSVIEAVGPLTLAFEQGEFISVIGPSGCGKSTLLNLIAGLEESTSGSVVFEGQRVVNRVPDGIGVVFQQDSSFPWLDVWNNIAFGLQHAGVNRAVIAERVDAILKLTGLQKFAHAYPAQLSGGMRQRVCIARTLVTQPRLILLDEPFGALDQQTRLLMGDEVLRLWRELGSTIFLITHSIDEAVMLSDRVVVMSARPGRVMDIVKTEWPRERTSEIVNDSRFGALTASIWRQLRAESLKALER